MKFKKDSLPEDTKDRIEYLYKFQEALRLFHNEKAKDFKAGRMTKAKFRRFQDEWFNPRNSLLCAKINECKERLKQSEVEVNIEDIEE